MTCKVCAVEFGKMVDEVRASMVTQNVLPKTQEQRDEAIQNMLKATVKGRGVQICQNTLRNMGKMVGMRATGELRGILKDVPLFIISAGPSLDKNKHLIAECMTKGLVMVVNTACPAVEAVGVKPHMQINVELMKLNKWHGVGGETMAVGVHTHPEVFDMAREVDGFWFLTASPHGMRQAVVSGVEPLLYGGSVSTAAFAMGLQFGCNPIVLIGQDLAYDLDKKQAYSTASGWDGMTVEWTPEGKLKFGGRQDERTELHRAYHVPLPPPERDPHVIVKYGGAGRVVSTIEFESQRKFFEDWRRFIPRDVIMVNATEGGAHLCGWEELTLADTLSRLPKIDGVRDRLMKDYPHARLSAETLGRLKSLLVSELGYGYQFAEQMLAQKHTPDIFEKMSMGYPFVEGMAAADLIGMYDVPDMNPYSRYQATYEIWKGAAVEVKRHLDEWPV